MNLPTGGATLTVNTRDPNLYDELNDFFRITEKDYEAQLGL